MFWIIEKEALRNYLEQKEKTGVRILEFKKLGTGWHGAGYKLSYVVGKKEKNIIIRTLSSIGFSHDYLSDRANVFVMQHNLFNEIPKHVKSIDVIGVDKKIYPVGNAKEFYQIVEEASGTDYFKDFERIKNTGKITDKDRKNALMLSNYLVNLHKKKFKGKKESADSIYKRHLRDTIGHGEMALGVIDTYPDISKLNWTNKNEISEIIKKSFLLKEKIKSMNRLCMIHGDFHPGNIWFNEKDFTVLDASREKWGDPAEDLVCLGLNYIWYAIMQTGKFEGPFKELFEIYWNNYIKKSKDSKMGKVAPLFFAWRGFVVAHPLFYRNQSDATRRKIFNLVNSVLKEENFDCKKINKYIRR